MAEATRRYAVVTGSNKGIGFAISKQLASNGITVVVTARDVKRGLEAVDKLKQLGLSDQLVFHQLDVTDPDSIASLASFIKTQFGKLDILVNNAAIVGANVDTDALEAAIAAGEIGANVEWTKFTTPTYESVAAGIRTNYYGAKGMCEAFIPLLKLADSPRIVNVSSIRGSLEVLDPKHRLVFCQTFWLSNILLLMLMQRLPNSWAKGVLSDVESLTEEKLDGVLNQFLEDFKESLLETKGWPTVSPAYRVSKVALNAYTRILAKKWHHFDQMSSVSANLHEN